MAEWHLGHKIDKEFISYTGWAQVNLGINSVRRVGRGERQGEAFFHSKPFHLI